MLETAGLWGKRADMIVRCLPITLVSPPAVLLGSDITRSMRSTSATRPGPRHRAAALAADGRRAADNPLTVTYERLTRLSSSPNAVCGDAACAGNRRAELVTGATDPR